MEHFRRIGISVLKKHFKILKHEYSTNPGLLSDITVLDLTRVVAGPVCSMTMGDLGANVIKVESFDGDESRKWGPPFIKPNKDSVYFLSVNRNKKSICIDFKTLEGKKVLHDLGKKCDVFVENFVPGKLEQYELGYDNLKVINPKLIYCSITGFGSTGPYAKKPGYDVVAAAMGGLLNSTGERNGDPVKAGVAITDITTGLHAFGAIMTALYFRQKTGQGQKIDCNLLSTQVSSMINIATVYLNCGIEGQRWGTAHANLVPYQVFKTQDGYIVIGTGSNAQFVDFCKIVGREDLITDERFKDNSKRVTNREEIIRIISDIIITKTTKEWTKKFKGVSFPNGPVNKMKDVFEDEHEPLVTVITLRAPQTQQRKKVVWAEDTVDNENMNKKKSKCCCIYEKPHKFDESDSDDSDDECEHCSGHVEKRKFKNAGAQPGSERVAENPTVTIQEVAEPQERTAVITLQPAEPTPAPAPAPPDKDGNIPQPAV